MPGYIRPNHLSSTSVPCWPFICPTSSLLPYLHNPQLDWITSTCSAYCTPSRHPNRTGLPGYHLVVYPARASNAQKEPLSSSSSAATSAQSDWAGGGVSRSLVASLVVSAISPSSFNFPPRLWSLPQPHTQQCHQSRLRAIHIHFPQALHIWPLIIPELYLLPAPSGDQLGELQAGLAMRECGWGLE